MRKGKSIKKIPGGKLLRIIVNYDARIREINITGDFFVEPAETIEELEQKIKGLELPITKEKLLEIINNVKKEFNAEFLGMTSESMTDAIMEALQ